MTDWNGNGRIDPVDIGIDIARSAPDEVKKKKNPDSAMRNSGCLTLFVISIVVALCGILAYVCLF